MEALVKNEVLPKIQQQFVLPALYHKTILTYGLGKVSLQKELQIGKTIFRFHQIGLFTQFGEGAIETIGKRH